MGLLIVRNIYPTKVVYLTLTLAYIKQCTSYYFYTLIRSYNDALTPLPVSVHINRRYQCISILGLSFEVENVLCSSSKYSNTGTFLVNC